MGLTRRSLSHDGEVATANVKRTVLIAGFGIVLLLGAALAG